ncbi:TonB C-terminal domain-containing protein, partial [bacterium]|nr:TonB C-terminal domain-containing protein [bacterium]
SLSVDVGEDGIGGGNVEPWLALYGNTIKDIIYNNWNNAFVDLKMGEKIVATVRFTILRSGQIKDIKIEKTSGNDVYDLAGIRAIKYSNPFPSLPPYFKNDLLILHFDFTYSPQ